MPNRVEKARKIADEMFFGPHKPECEIPTDQTMTVRYGHAVELIAAALSAAHAEPVGYAVPVSLEQFREDPVEKVFIRVFAADYLTARGKDLSEYAPFYASPSEAAIRADERAAIRKEAFEEAAKIARIEAAQCASLGCTHPENSETRDRLFARARSAEAIATAIRARGET